MKKFFAIIGKPVSHSLSPILHNYWFKKYNIDAEYSLIDIEETGLTRIAEEIRNKKLSGVNAVVLGRSLLFDKPMGQILLLENSTVTMTHSKTKNIKEHCKKADVLIVAAGRPQMVDASWVNKDSIIIDVGINRVSLGEDNYKIIGDVDFENVSKVVKAITPVPGGVGPMTIACLMFNTLTSAQIQNGISPFPWNELHSKLNI